MDSPFSRSTMTSRSPPQKRPIEVTVDREETSADPVQLVSTPEIQQWLSSIEQCLNDICCVSNEGKLNTEQKLKISKISRKVLGGVSQLAVQYQSLKQKYISAQTALRNQEDKNDFSDQIQDLKLTIKSAQKASPQSVSFAETVRKGNTLMQPHNTSSITIYPTDKHRSSEDTKKLVQTIIKPDQLKLHIRGMRKTKDGGIIINAERKTDLVKLKESKELMSSGLKLEDTKKRRPKIILLGVPSNTSEKDVFECLFEQNISDKYSDVSREQFLSSVKLSHKSGKKDSPYCNFIIELPADLRKLLIDQERVFINWTSCPVRDFTLVTRCYKCQQYGHSAKYCRDPAPTCGHCGIVGHIIKDCPKSQEPQECATCKRFNKPSQHRTGDVQCPARKSAEARYHSSIDYECV